MTFNHKTILLWGFGKTGRSISRYIEKHYPESQIIILDKNKEKINVCDIPKNCITFLNESEWEKYYHKVDIIIPSPGVKLPHEIINSSKLLCELDAFYALWRGSIIAITGSIGKTTITTFVHKILASNDNDKICLGGNIGIPVFDLLGKENEEDVCAVLEVSSAQLQYARKFSPQYIIWNNIYDNHLDMHNNSFADYVDAKSTMVFNSLGNKDCVFIFGYTVWQRIKDKINYYYNDCKKVSKIIVIAENNEEKKIVLSENNNCITILSVENEAINELRQGENNKLKKTFLINKNNIPVVSHFQNWLCIVGLLKALDITIEGIEHLLKNISFDTPEHRFELVQQNKYPNVNVINDSKSTIIDATLAAIKQCKEQFGNDCYVTVIIGGLSKGVDRKEKILQCAQLCNTIIFFGKEAPELNIFCTLKKDTRNSTCDFIEVKELTGVCAVALHVAHANINKKNIILFSPGGSSFDLFTSYEERGKTFKELIMN